MRWMIWVVAILAMLWGGYWVVGSTALERAAVQWFADQPAQGREASYSALTVEGFPSRFDMTITDPRLADPATGFGWDAPFVQLLTLSYTPWHMIAALPNSQSFRTPAGTITLQSDKMQASVIVTPGPRLALDRTTLLGTGLAASGPGWSLAARELRLATRIDASGPNAHQIGVEVLDLTPDTALSAALTEASPLPALIGRLRLDATARLTTPLDRFATDIQATEITVKDASIVWGDLSGTASGKLVAGAGGRAEGRIDLRLQNWRLLIPVLVATGAVTPDLAPTVENMLAALAGDDPANLQVPLTFAKGRISLGPLPVGIAPMMR
ncbi:MAG: DUF2125 domain-containing protein [Pseudomonadota bacterium]